MERTAALTLELHHNNRTIQGLNRLEKFFTDDYGWAVIPGVRPGKDHIIATLSELDLGRFDSEGDSYLVELLDIVAGDLISWTLEEVG
jgi:hypothetical protein